MIRIAAHANKILRLLPRAALLLTLLAAPVLAVPLMQGNAGSTIEAPSMKKSGIGFVLLVSLQRG
jgi:hypothetical protein